MHRIGATLILIGALALTGSASGHVRVRLLASHAAVVRATQARSLAPTPAELGHARRVAMAYWHTQNPPCGRETVASKPLVTTLAAETAWDTCTITFSATQDWIDFPTELCVDYVHEYGHLVLGPEYFAASNPTDPAHSPDPTNIMYAGAGTERQYRAQARSVGCL